MSRGRLPKHQAKISEAKLKEKECSWAEAAVAYEQALDIVEEQEFSKQAATLEKVGSCLSRAAMQSLNQDQFLERMGRAVDAYTRASELYEKRIDGEEIAGGYASRSLAVARFLEHWLVKEPSEKRRLLDESLDLESQALSTSSESGNTIEYARTYGDLPLLFDCRGNLESDRQTLKEIVDKGVEWGKRAVEALAEVDNTPNAPSVYFAFATSLSFLGDFIVEPEAENDNRLRVVRILKKAVDLSEETGDLRLSGWGHLWLGISTGGKESIGHFQKALEYGKQIRHNLLIGGALNALGYSVYWEAKALEDPDQKTRRAERALKLCDQAQLYLARIPFLSTTASIRWPAGFAEQVLDLAIWETDREKRLEHLAAASKAGAQALQSAEAAAQPYAISYVLNVVSKILEAQARWEPNLEARKQLLERALQHRERNMRILDELIPFDYWNRGVQQNYLAEIKADLVETHTDTDRKRKLLKEAISAKGKCLDLCSKTMPYYESMGSVTPFAALQSYQDTYGTLLTRFFDLTGDTKHLKAALEVYGKSIESARKLDMATQIAEVHWKIGKILDVWGKNLEAGRNYELASESYLKAAEKIQQLRDFYRDHATYMQAWAEIERAKHHHAEKQYGVAKSHYAKAADLHRATEAWNYLGTNYAAWAQLEEAEELSRRERVEEAKQTFVQSAKTFEEAKRTIQARLKNIEAREETEATKKLAKASDVRRKYCLGRTALEEAKLLDRKNSLRASSSKFESAADTFEAITRSEPEQSRREIQPLIFLCRAWKSMKTAEATTSPEMYGQAADLFEKAKEHSLDQPTSMLAQANSSFCKALQAGTEFEANGNAETYLTAKKHLEVAAKTYLLAGYKKASDYARATNRLFDAYMHMKRAETETDPRKKAQFYQMAEKLLEASAGSYHRAKHSTKSEQIRHLLGSVREERELALSLTELLDAPAAASATASFSTPSPMYEAAFGLEKFEQASIQSNLTIDKKEVRVGDDITLEIELTNAGKASALLAKCQQIVPKGFEIREIPEAYRVEDSLLNMKGKQLGPLKTEELRIVARPSSKGVFTFSPQILYMDEHGDYKTHTPEPITITVRELGIMGWIRGE